MRRPGFSQEVGDLNNLFGPVPRNFGGWPRIFPGPISDTHLRGHAGFLKRMLHIPATFNEPARGMGFRTVKIKRRFFDGGSYFERRQVSGQLPRAGSPAQLGDSLAAGEVLAVIFQRRPCDPGRGVDADHGGKRVAGRGEF